jgi:uncharacterized membrane protein
MNSKHDCDYVINSMTSRIFGRFEWSDLGFIYSTSGVVLFIIFLITKGIDIIGFMYTISIIGILISVYLLFYQTFVLKRFCNLCLIFELFVVLNFLFLR